MQRPQPRSTLFPYTTLFRSPCFRQLFFRVRCATMSKTQQQKSSHCSLHVTSKVANSRMPNLATWIRPKDAKWFRPIFGKHPEIKVWNALKRKVPLEKMDGLLLTGGSDISSEFLRQKVADPSVLSKDMDPERDRWEFEAVQEALSRGLPILAICKGLQVF